MLGHLALASVSVLVSQSKNTLITSKTRLSVVSIVSVSCSTVFVSSPELDQYLALILCIAAAVLSIKTSSQCGLDLSIAHCQGEQRMQSTHFIQLS